MSGSRVYQGSSPQVSSGQWPGDLVLAVAGETQLLVIGSVKCLQTQSVGQAMLFGLTRRVESPGLVLPGVEMVPPGIHRSVAGPGIRSSPPPRVF